MSAYWLFKSEPYAFSLDDLKAEPEGTAFWDGVRNYQARNYLRDTVKLGDRVFFYHSGVKAPAVVGVAGVVREGYPDPAQFDSRAEYFDPKARLDSPRWYGVDIRFEGAFEKPVTLATIKGTPSLAEMPLVNRSRLSIQPVSSKAWKVICKLGGYSA